MKLEETELPRRLWTKLHDLGIKTVDDLCQHSLPDLLRYEGVGRKSTDQIEQMLASIGKTLKPSPWANERFGLQPPPAGSRAGAKCLLWYALNKTRKK